MRVLVTGFEPFGGEEVNPSWEVAKLIAQEELKGITIVAKQLPTVFGTSSEQLIEEVTRVKPDLVIALGQAGGRSAISVERVAINIDDSGIADNANKQPEDELIVPGAPVAYFSTLPFKKIVRALQAEGIPASVSNTAGTFVCNHVLYGLLHYIAQNELPIKAGFIHIPYLPEQAVKHRNAPSMALENLVRGLKIAIEACDDK